ncbi:hypothetical protein [Cellulomonas palmilytica]|uniref:hypothetical protein n=1 Tax=Cellulomonas palmilytica TaxID=2608402 RepID=UPI001F1CDECA|nr:hypothetical protein [Cellulomonas palmilytica]UJP40013.1 hypothetical protein F1D97_00125 [Cellulomonas palmilytica]
MHPDLYLVVHAERERDLEHELTRRRLARTDPDRFVPAGTPARLTALLARSLTSLRATARVRSTAPARRAAETACACPA